jgi:hypothetical protein
MTYAEQFEKQRYIAVKGLLDPLVLQYLQSYYHQFVADGLRHFRRDGTSINGYGEACADLALYAMREKIEVVTGLQLLPGFSFVRLYKKGEKLRRHIDRGANEVNCTLQIYGNTSWPLGVHVAGQDITVHQDNGDGLIYRGLEIPHWRDVYTGDEHLQLILAYVVKDGEHQHCAFDGRGGPIYRPSGTHELLRTKLLRFAARIKRRILGQPPID